MRTISFWFVALALIFIIISCSELKKNLPVASEGSLKLHDSGWSQEDSPNFHGKYLKKMDYNQVDCYSCHAKNLTGGSSGVSCYKCHVNYPHNSSWIAEDSLGFHGKYLNALHNNTNLCTPCHGSDLRGGTSGVSCVTCHSTYPHPNGWTAIDSVSFHGKFLKTNDYQLSMCSSCHGSDFLGGSSGVSCFTCHASFPHKTGWNTDTSTVGFHGKYLQTKDWATTECKSCHGSSYNGGTSDKACFTCHTSFPHEAKFTDGHESYMENNNYPLSECKTCHGVDLTGGVRINISCSQSGCHRDASNNPKSPEACNTCHGVFNASADSTITWAPPRSVNGNTATSDRGVGAHQKHIATGTIGKTVKCTECHTIPANISDVDHIDSPFNVTVAFHDTLANLVTANGIINPAYQSSTLTCNNTFCHGNWKLRKSASGSQFVYADSIMVGSNYSAIWTGGSTQSDCGTTCHNNPPLGHISSNITACSSCHSGVINSSGLIIDRTKHMNGKINVFGNEIVFPQ
jgi:hypothetical protein